MSGLWYYNNKRKKVKRKLSRTDADIIASKNLFDDRRRGIERPLSYYDKQSDELCRLPSREIYNGEY